MLAISVVKFSFSLGNECCSFVSSHRSFVLPKSEDRDRYESSAVEGDAALAISSLAFVSYRKVSPLVC